MTKEEITNYKHQILKDLYRYRNGALADTLRTSGLPFKKIFGLILPQLSEIAKQYPQEIDLAISLWREQDCREFRLLAFYLMPHSVEQGIIEEMILDLKSKEEAELLPFRLLRHLPYTNDLRVDMEANILEGNFLHEYFLKMFRRNLGIEE